MVTGLASISTTSKLTEFRKVTQPDRPVGRPSLNSLPIGKISSFYDFKMPSVKTMAGHHITPSGA